MGWLTEHLAYALHPPLALARAAGCQAAAVEWRALRTHVCVALGRAAARRSVMVVVAADCGGQKRWSAAPAPSKVRVSSVADPRAARLLLPRGQAAAGPLLQFNLMPRPVYAVGACVALLQPAPRVLAGASAVSPCKRQ